MPMPVKKRVTLNMPSEPTRPLAIEARPKIVRLTSNSGLRPTRSPIGPALSAPTMMPMLEKAKAEVSSAGFTPHALMIAGAARPTADRS